MELTKTKELQICPIKRLYLELDENLPDRKIIAIVLTTEIISRPNMLIYKEQMRAFGIKVCKIKLKYLKHLSEKALNRAINGKM